MAPRRVTLYARREEMAHLRLVLAGQPATHGVHREDPGRTHLLLDHRHRVADATDRRGVIAAGPADRQAAGPHAEADAGVLVEQRPHRRAPVQPAVHGEPLERRAREDVDAAVRLAPVVAVAQRGIVQPAHRAAAAPLALQHPAVVAGLLDGPQQADLRVLGEHPDRGPRQARTGEERVGVDLDDDIGIEVPAGLAQQAGDRRVLIRRSRARPAMVQDDGAGHDRPDARGAAVGRRVVEHDDAGVRPLPAHDARQDVLEAVALALAGHDHEHRPAALAAGRGGRVGGLAAARAPRPDGLDGRVAPAPGTATSRPASVPLT